MKTHKSLNFLLSFFLVLGFLGGCQNPERETLQQPNPNSELRPVNCSETANSLAQAYYRFNTAQTNFFTNLQLALGDENLQATTNSQEFSNCLELSLIHI